MKIDWSGIVRDIATLQPAAVGRVVRIAIVAGGTLIVGKGVTSEQTNHIVSLVEIAVGGLAWVVAYVLSHSSDVAVKKDAATAPLSEEDLAKLIDEAGRDVDVPPDRWGPVARTIDHAQPPAPTTPLVSPPAGGDR